MTDSQTERTLNQCTTRMSARQQNKKQSGNGSSQEEVKGGDRNGNLSNQKRMKERTIQDIIEKVSLWRKLYNGVQDKDGNLLRYSLEDAA